MNLKPLRDITNHNVVNYYKLDRTGEKAMPVSISSGFDNSQQFKLHNNLSPIANTFSPRFAIKAEVTPTVSGNKPFGVTLFSTEEVNQWNYPLMFDVQRKIEKQCVLSGEAVPIVRQGYLMVGPWGTGLSPAVGRYVAVAGTGDWGISLTKTGVVGGVTGAQLPIFGEFLGQKDRDGYALVYIDCTF